MNEVSQNHAMQRAHWRNARIERLADQLIVDGYPVIESWEKPLMAGLAQIVTTKPGHILEVGFGMGWSAESIALGGCLSHTIIEAHPIIADQARRWATRQTHPVQILEGFWQDIVPTLGRTFDGILFDTCPVDESERDQWLYPFLSVAWDLLAAGGVFTYYSNECDEFRPAHMHLLRTHFPDVAFLRIAGLRPPVSCIYWQADHMVIPVIRRNLN